MVLDGLRGYLQLANGLTDVTRERALQVAKSLVAQGEASVGAVLPDSLKTQVGSVTEDLLATSKANRALLLGLVGSEVERATARLGLAMAGELEAAKRRAQRLEQRVADLEREVRGEQPASKPSPQSGTAHSAASAPSVVPAAKKATAKKSTARTRKSPARKSPARKSPAKKAPAKTAAAQTSPPQASPGESTTAQTTPAETST